MGCGCRKNTTKRKTVSRTRASAKNYTISSSVHSKRKKACVKCKYATKISPQNYIRKCLKSNKPLGAIVRDPYFKCPLGNFGRTK